MKKIKYQFNYDAQSIPLSAGLVSYSSNPFVTVSFAEDITIQRILFFTKWLNNSPTSKPIGLIQLTTSEISRNISENVINGTEPTGQQTNSIKIISTLQAINQKTSIFLPRLQPISFDFIAYFGAATIINDTLHSFLTLYVKTFPTTHRNL